MKDVTMEAMVALALDMTEVMKLDPAIETEGVSEEDLAAAIKADAEAVDEDGKPCGVFAKDKLQDASWATLEAMGVAAEEVAKRTKKTAPKKEAPVAGKKKAEKVVAPKAAPKGKAQKAAKEAEAPKAAPAPKAQKAAKVPVEKKPRYTRDTAFAGAIQTGVKDEAKLIEKADELYQKATGAGPNPKEARWTHSKAIGLLSALGLVVVENGKVTYNG